MFDKVSKVSKTLKIVSFLVSIFYSITCELLPKSYIESELPTGIVQELHMNSDDYILCLHSIDSGPNNLALYEPLRKVVLSKNNSGSFHNVWRHMYFKLTQPSNIILSKLMDITTTNSVLYTFDDLH